MKKPTGTTGSIRISPNNIFFKRIILPDAKEDIENFVMERFVEDTNKRNAPFKFISYNQNKQDDFDFCVETTIGKSNLDLMEVALLHKGGHESAGNKYHDLEFGKNIFNKISKKSKKYGNKKQPIILLLYPTDFKFNFSELAMQYLQYLLNKEDHCFIMVFYFSLLDNQEGYAQLLFPSEINDFDEERYKNNITINLL